MSAVEEQQPVVVQLKPKNKHRLHRIFRKPKETPAPRPWHRDDGKKIHHGITKEEVLQLVAGLTQEEKDRAVAKEDPMTATQEELTKRAARFGLTLQVPHQPVKTVHVDEAVLASRAARFHMADTGKETLEARAARFAPKADPVIDPSTLSEEARAALEQRARRFGML